MRTLKTTLNYFKINFNVYTIKIALIFFNSKFKLKIKIITKYTCPFFIHLCSVCSFVEMNIYNFCNRYTHIQEMCVNAYETNMIFVVNGNKHLP